jgi:flavin reductase (DIM6/NTAB) family NADH-FMN oxidoreductase RutF
MTEQDKQAIAALNTISYGLYIISSRNGDRLNAQCGNSLFQITTSPRRVAIGINKGNYTFEFIKASGVLAVSVLRLDQIPHVKHFGLQSGRKVDKFATVKYETRETGCPILPNALAWFECRVIAEQCIDCGTHMLFLCDVVGGSVLAGGEPLTYDYYRKNRIAAVQGSG